MVFYDYLKIYFEIFALSAKRNPSGAVPTDPRTTPSSSELVSHLVSSANLPTGFPLYSPKNHPYGVTNSSLKTCMK